jgi:hypothetical protein
MTPSETETPTSAAEQRIVELESLVRDRDRLAALLADAEQRTAGIPELEQRVADLQEEAAAHRRTAEIARLEAQQLDQMLMYGRRALRYVRPAIKPLRDARRRLRG